MDTITIDRFTITQLPKNRAHRIWALGTMEIFSEKCSNEDQRGGFSRRFSRVVPVAQWHVNAVIGLGLTGRSAATCAIHGQPIAAASPKPRVRRVAVPFTVLCFADTTLAVFEPRRLLNRTRCFRAGSPSPPRALPPSPGRLVRPRSRDRPGPPYRDTSMRKARAAW